MAPYTGVIIEESLEDKRVFHDLKIIKTIIEQTTPEHKSSVPQWTMHTVFISEDQAEEIAMRLSKSLRSEASWYADFKNDTHHYIIFRNKVFFIDKQNKKKYDEAKRYGMSLGIPEHQVDFHPDTRQWKR